MFLQTAWRLAAPPTQTASCPRLGWVLKSFWLGFEKSSLLLGSENWLEKWVVCSSGRLQSPIDLCDEKATVVDSLGPLRRTYRLACALMKNRGHDIMLKWEENAGGVWINGSECGLKQLHWHSL